MVNRDYIPLSMILDRRVKLSSISESDEPLKNVYDYDTVLESMDTEQERNVVSSVFRSCQNPVVAEHYWQNTLDLLAVCKDKPYYKNLFGETVSNIFPYYKNINEVYDKIESIDLPIEDKDTMKSTLHKLESCDRLLENYNMISERFNLEEFQKGCSLASNNIVDLEQVVESFCTLIDTYNMSLRKKVGVTLETAKYINEQYGSSDKTSEMVQYIVEYYLKNYPVIPDRDYKSIINTLESNAFLTDKDVINVNYMFNEASDRTFQQKILEVADKTVDKQYKDLIIKIANCKTVAVLKGLIKAAIALIYTTFVIAAVVPWSLVVVLLCTLFSTIVTVAIAPAVVVGAIRSELKKSEENLKAIQPTRDQMKRHNKVYRFTSDICADVSNGDAYAEAGALVDSLAGEGVDAPILKDKIEDDGFNFTFLNDYDNVLESENFADSDDVMDLIKKYKADQDKSQPKLKRLITKLMTKKPQHIIDNLPNILELIRVFCVLSTAAIPVVGPGIALIGIIVDHFVSMTIKREEADRVVKYFKEEKAKLEKKYDGMKDGEKKDALDDYIKCLDKSIDKLEDYRDSLYTSKELDAQYELDEATLNITDKITLDQFYQIHFGGLCQAAVTATQLIRNEVVRMFLTSTYTEYEYNGVPISESLPTITANELLSFYTTPRGMVDIPLGKLVPKDPCCPSCLKDEYVNSVQICSTINKYIDGRFIVTSYQMSSGIAFTLNCFICIGVDYNPMMENTLTESAIGMIADVLVNEAMINEATKYNENTIVNEMKASLDVILQCKDTCDQLPSYLKISGIDVSDLVEELMDYDDDEDDPNNNAKTLLTNISTGDDANDYNTSYDYITQLEAVDLLQELVTEAKAKKKSPKKKGEPSLIEKAKQKQAEKKKENEKKEKVPIGTTAKLAAQAAKDTAKKTASKEKEVSKTVDAYASTIQKSIKKAMTSNRREAIIKGSVIPSFSRMIKAAVAIGAVSIITNPVIGAITAIGGLAVSKYLTVKEKNLLLEEIEVELKVIEKQIDKAEDDPKKYKQLLMYQRKLQRESQRIRYGLKVKGKDVPDPTV